MNAMRKIFLLLAAVLLPGTYTVFAQTDEEQQRKYDYYFLESVRQKTLGKYDAAFDLLQHCLEINPKAASAHYELAQYYMYLKREEQAVQALEKAVANDPDNFWYAQGLANLYQKQDETEKATALLEQMTTRFPNKVDPLYNLLDLYNRAEEYDKVLALLNKLEQRTGKSEQLTMEKFRIYLQKKDHKRAFREIESLVEEYPMDTRYQVVLGDAYLQNGKEEEAYELYRNVLDQEPDNAMALYSLATYYQETGQEALYQQQLDTLLLNRKVPSETKLLVMRQLIVENERTDADSTRIIGLFDRILEEDPEDAQLPLLYVQYLLSKGMDKETVPVLNHVLDIDPTHTAARMTLLGEAIKAEDYKEVTRLCEGGVVANPDRPEFYFYLAIAYNQDGRTDDVIATCQKALEEAREGAKKEVVSDFFTIMGDAYYEKKLTQQAYAAYDSALVYFPENIPALNNYAYYLSLERRDLDRAEEMSYKTIQAEPKNATYLDTYAWILFEKGNYAEARIYIDDALLSDTEKSAGIVEHGGDIYYMTGDTDKAVEMWQKARDMGIKSEVLEQKIKAKK
ncbi:MAG TPA: tetratricopeptide repeat protein, partial [Candidatus Bacteroides pullicola]|nr:tetratricopeptide repeat protein [Candidatus Bacteroides pullicola]